jgi:hypothetical protein
MDRIIISVPAALIAHVLRRLLLSQGSIKFVAAEARLSFHRPPLLPVPYRLPILHLSSLVLGLWLILGQLRVAAF